jgi:hypothetical protein
MDISRRNALIIAAFTVAVAADAVAGFVPIIFPAEPEQQQEARPNLPASAVIPDLRFDPYHGIRLPRSVSGGPRDRRNGLARGFARTGVGALMAAVHIFVRMEPYWGPKVFEPTFAHQVIGPDSRFMLITYRNGYEAARKELDLPAGAPIDRGHWVIEAFRWQAYTPDAATVGLVTAQHGDGGKIVRTSTRIELEWFADDGKVHTPPGGTWKLSDRVVTSIEGYFLFQGRS